MKKKKKRALKKEKGLIFCKTFLLRIRWWAVASFLLFALFFLIGFSYPFFFREEIFTLMADLFDIFEGKGLLATSWAIFFNNVRTSFFAIVLGVFFGIFPLVIIVLNGYLTGFVSREAATVLGLGVLWRLVPHGIFELPAIMFSVGLGIRLGYLVLKKDPHTKEEFRNSMRFFLFVIIPLLVLAAIVEGFFLFYG